MAPRGDPVDIKGSYPKTEETFSLRTKDAKAALILVRKAAAEVDERFAAHRRQPDGRATPPLKELSKAHLARIEELYYAHLLDEDEDVRLEGFYDEQEPRPLVPVPTFEERAEDVEVFGDIARYMLARGKGDNFYRLEAEEVLTWDGLGITLAADSPDWKLAIRAIQSAIVRAQDAIAGRNRGDVVAAWRLERELRLIFSVSDANATSHKRNSARVLTFTRPI